MIITTTKEIVQRQFSKNFRYQNKKTTKLMLYIYMFLNHLTFFKCINYKILKIQSSLETKSII